MHMFDCLYYRLSLKKSQEFPSFVKQYSARIKAGSVVRSRTGFRQSSMMESVMRRNQRYRRPGSSYLFGLCVETPAWMPFLSIFIFASVLFLEMA